MTSAEISALRHKSLDPQAINKKTVYCHIKLLPVASPPLIQGIASLKYTLQVNIFLDNEINSCRSTLNLCGYVLWVAFFVIDWLKQVMMTFGAALSHEELFDLDIVLFVAYMG